MDKASDSLFDIVHKNTRANGAFCALRVMFVNPDPDIIMSKQNSLLGLFCAF